MKNSILTHLNVLKTSLLSLKSTGQDGFEGLIAEILQEISGVGFRLASSGYQRGVDGATSFEDGGIGFEAKLYSNPVPRTEVISKIADLSRNGQDDDLVWVLGATVQIKTQLASDLRADGRKAGVSVFILDWSDTDIPPLAVALAMAPNRVVPFLEKNTPESAQNSKTLASLKEIAKHENFEKRSKHFVEMLDAPSVGMSLARKSNQEWFHDVFSDEKRARAELGQPLSPNDKRLKSFLQRKAIIQKSVEFFENSPDGQVLSIHGGEGHGKSWIVSQTWLSLDDKPLLIFLVPDDFGANDNSNDIENLLLDKLLMQTGGSPLDGSRRRWERRIYRWRDGSAPTKARFVVMLDGINQRPATEWGKIINRLGFMVADLGGKLVVTSRKHFFQSRVRGAISLDVTELEIPEWTVAERNQILTEHGCDVEEVGKSVSTSLLNPRLLGIALRLYDSNSIESIEELSVSRLLFEHIMAGVKDQYGNDPIQFVESLKNHAKSLLARVEEKQAEDLLLIEGDTCAVAEGRFFSPVEGAPTKYELREDGLTLALGYSIIEHLVTAERNGRNVDETLELLIEPISALDLTADAILAALIVCTSEGNPYSTGPDIVVAIIKGFCDLQNPDDDMYAAFCGIAKISPAAFLDALRDLCLAGGAQPNLDWVQAALSEASNSATVWSVIATKIETWLEVYSIAPERMMFKRKSRDPENDVEEEYKKVSGRIQEKLSVLTSAESTRLATLIKSEGDVDKLAGMAFSLLAGKRLEPFANSLVNWAFSNAIYSAIYSPTKEFIRLISFNLRDWDATREALMEAAKVFQNTNASTTAKWALLMILRSTGDSDNDKVATAIYEELTKDRERFEGWRMLDDYSISDPCDPKSIKSANVTATAKKYLDIDVSKLRLSMSSGMGDHFFVDARPAMVRFASQTAITKHIEFTEHVLTRDGLLWRQGILELRNHAPLITEDHANCLKSRWFEIRADMEALGLSDKDTQFTLNYVLLSIFPHLGAMEQAEILLQTNDGDVVYLELLEKMKPLSSTLCEQLIEGVLKQDSEYHQYLLLEIMLSNNIAMSGPVREFVAANLSSKVIRLQSAAMAIVSRSQDTELLRVFAESDWTAFEADDAHLSYVWYGSLALVEAASSGLLNSRDALDRISPRLYGQAAIVFDQETTREIANRVDATIKKIANLPDEFVASEVVIDIEAGSKKSPERYSIEERQPTKKPLNEFMKTFNEDDGAFEERQKRAHDAFSEFRKSLTTAKAHIILDRITFEEFDAIVRIAPNIGDEWYGLFLDMNNVQLRSLHNFVLMLSHTFSDQAPEKSVALIETLNYNQPLVSFVYGVSKLPLEAIIVWRGDCSPLIEKLRFQRLDAAENNFELSREVFAALKNNQHNDLEKYVAEKLSKSQPTEIARGIMVAGFSDYFDFNTDILQKFSGSEGLIGRAYDTAIFAYERNIWARYWYSKMCTTEDPQDFWRYSVLFMRIVDERFDIWEQTVPPRGKPIQTFGIIDTNKLRHRYDKWKKNRTKKLFGEEAPPAYFVQNNLALVNV